MKKTDVQVDKQPAAAEQANGAEPLVALETATLAPEQLEELKERAAKADEHWERMLRTTADLENFKKRALREKQEAIKFANEPLLRKLIPALVNVDRPITAAENPQ